MDGTLQALEGWTMDRITATMPTISMTKAEEDIKSDDKGNKELQDLKCEPAVGGDIDILLGLLYQKFFPIAVHTLENGLTIYKLQITPHDKRYNSVIGGPHESFSIMGNYFGGLNTVFAGLCRQLESFRKNGPTKLSNIMMTEEDIQFAEKFKEWEIRGFSDTVYEADVNFENKAQVEVKDIALNQKSTSGNSKLGKPKITVAETVSNTFEDVHIKSKDVAGNDFFDANEVSIPGNHLPAYSYCRMIFVKLCLPKTWMKKKFLNLGKGWLSKKDLIYNIAVQNVGLVTFVED